MMNILTHDTQYYKDAATKLKRFVLKERLRRSFKDHNNELDHLTDAFMYAVNALKGFGTKLEDVKLPRSGYNCRHTIVIDDSEVLIHKSNINPEYSGCVDLTKEGIDWEWIDKTFDCKLLNELARKKKNEQIVRDAFDEVCNKLFPKNIPLSCYRGQHFMHETSKGKVCFYCKNTFGS